MCIYIYTSTERLSYARSGCTSQGRGFVPQVGADSDAFCGCRQGYRENGMGGCVLCEEGMVCPGLNETSIASGYYADFVSSNGELSSGWPLNGQTKGDNQSLNVKDSRFVLIFC